MADILSEEEIMRILDLNPDGTLKKSNASFPFYLRKNIDSVIQDALNDILSFLIDVKLNKKGDISILSEKKIKKYINKRLDIAFKLAKANVNTAMEDYTENIDGYLSVTKEIEI